MHKPVIAWRLILIEVNILSSKTSTMAFSSITAICTIPLGRLLGQLCESSLAWQSGIVSSSTCSGTCGTCKAVRLKQVVPPKCHLSGTSGFVKPSHCHRSPANLATHPTVTGRDGNATAHDKSIFQHVLPNRHFPNKKYITNLVTYTPSLQQ